MPNLCSTNGDTIGPVTIRAFIPGTAPDLGGAFGQRSPDRYVLFYEGTDLDSDEFNFRIELDDGRTVPLALTGKSWVAAAGGWLLSGPVNGPVSEE